MIRPLTPFIARLRAAFAPAPQSLHAYRVTGGDWTPTVPASHCVVSIQQDGAGGWLVLTADRRALR